jgi:hypothetical protein
MIGRTIRITAVVDSRPPASGNEPSRRWPQPRKQPGVVGQFRDPVALLAPQLECVDHVGEQRYRPDLAALALNAEIHPAATVVRAPLVKRIGRKRARLLRPQPGATERLDQREVRGGVVLKLVSRA